MRRRANVGVVLLVLALAVIVAGLVFFAGVGYVSEKVSKFLRGARGGVVSKTVQNTVKSAKKIYSNFHLAWDMAMNPWKYTYTANPAKPTEEVLRENYGFKIENLVSVSPIPYFSCKDVNCSDVDIPPIAVLAPVYYHFLSPTDVYFHCNVTTSYDDLGCFEKIVKISPSQEKASERGTVTTRCTVKLVFNKTNIRCHKCDFLSSKVDIKKCLNEPVVFKDEGFRVNIKVNAVFTTESQTTYKTLIIPERTFIESIVRKRNVYSMLKLSQVDYDSGYYNGLLEYPRVDIGRLVYNEYKYPIILFGDNWSYDVYIFEIRDINNIQEIKDFTVKFLIPKGVELKYLDFSETGSLGKCTDTLNYEINLQANGKMLKPFSISCSGDTCRIKVDPSYLKNLRASGRDLKINIPICVKSHSFTGDYADLVVTASIRYVYNSVVETPYSLTYELYKFS